MTTILYRARVRVHQTEVVIEGERVSDVIEEVCDRWSQKARSIFFEAWQVHVSGYERLLDSRKIA